MSKCPEFFEMYKKWGSACLSTSIEPKKIEAHIKIVEAMAEKYKINADLIYLRFPMAASKHLLRYKEDSEIRIRTIDLIANLVKKEMKVTSDQVRTWLYYEGQPVPSKHVPPGNTAKLASIMTDVASISDVKKDILKPEGVKTRDVVLNDALVKTSTAVKAGDVKTKIQYLRNALTTGQQKILSEIMIKYDLSDELSAISKALILAKERMDNE